MSIADSIGRAAGSALAEFAIDLGARLAKKAVNGASADDLKQELIQGQAALDAVDWAEDQEMKKRFPDYRDGQDG